MVNYNVKQKFIPFAVRSFHGNDSYDPDMYTESTEASEFDPNHQGAQPQLRVKGAYNLAPNSDVPDKTKDQIVYLENKPNGLTFVDAVKCNGLPGRTMHERAFYAKNGSLPTAENYPLAGAGHMKGKVKTNSTTFNSSSKKPNGTAGSRSETSDRLEREMKILLSVEL